MSEKLLKGGEYLIKNTAAEDVFTPEDFNDEQKQIAETTEQFVTNEVVPNIEEIDNQNFDIVIEGMKKCGELGLLMIDAPEEYGGLELDKATSMLVAEKLAPGGSFLVAYAAHTGIGMLPLIYYGTKEQKERYLEKLMTGEMLAAYCLTEPGSGSDALGAKTSAVLSDDGKYYLLNGTKQWITNAGFADLFTVFAKVDKEHFTAFLVERDFEGVSFGAEEKKMGIKGSSTRQVNFDNAKVPVENVLGEIGKGHKIAFNVLNVGRFKLAAATTGACKDALGEAVRYANERKQFGTEISNFGAIKEKFARMTAETFASESLVYRLAGLLDDKIGHIDKDVENYYEEYQKAIEEYAIECGISKVFCSEVLAYVVDETVQIFGGYGFSQEYPAERFYRDERINRIFEGTNEINRLLTPGILLKKTMKGELPLQKEAMKAMESLMTPSLEEPEDGLFAKELKIVDDLKTVFLVTAGAAVQKHMEKMKDEQEILMALADVAIGIFAIESTVLRALKIYEKSNDKKKKLLEAAVNVFLFHEVEDITRAAKKAAYFVEEGDNLTMLLSGIRRFTKYDAAGLLDNQRLLADAVIDAEKYIF
jgi:alkylation response protein AidB-like acyl-CoA dehydrogenase